MKKRRKLQLSRETLHTMDLRTAQGGDVIQVTVQATTIIIKETIEIAVRSEEGCPTYSCCCLTCPPCP